MSRVVVCLALVLSAAAAHADSPVTRARTRDTGAFLTFELADPPQTCTVWDPGSQSFIEVSEFLSVFVNQSNNMLSYDLSSSAPGVFFSFSYDNPCGSTHLYPWDGTGVTDATAYGDPQWASQYISFQGAIDEGVGPDGWLAWTRIDQATFPVYLGSDGCYLQATMSLDSSAVGPVEHFVSNSTTINGPGFTRTHGQFRQRAATASGTLTLTPLDPACPAPPSSVRFLARAISYYPWGDVASTIYKSDFTDITVPRPGH